MKIYIFKNIHKYNIAKSTNRANHKYTLDLRLFEVQYSQIFLCKITELFAEKMACKVSHQVYLKYSKQNATWKLKTMGKIVDDSFAVLLRGFPLWLLIYISFYFVFKLWKKTILSTFRGCLKYSHELAICGQLWSLNPRVSWCCTWCLSLGTDSLSLLSDSNATTNDQSRHTL